jgi:hypothetical protein
MHDHFGVTAGVKDMTQGLQLRNELLVVVDLAIEDNHDRTIFIEQRLLPGSNVNNGKASMSKPNTGLNMQATVIGPAMPLGVVHALQHGTVNFAAATDIDDAGNATHDVQE